MLDDWPMLVVVLCQLSLAFYTRSGVPEARHAKPHLPEATKQHAMPEMPVFDDYTEIVLAFSHTMKNHSRTFESDSVLPFPREQIAAALMSARKDPVYASAPRALDLAERALATYLPESRIGLAARLLQDVLGQMSEGNGRWFETLQAAPVLEREAVSAVLLSVPSPGPDSANTPSGG